MKSKAGAMSKETIPVNPVWGKGMEAGGTRRSGRERTMRSRLLCAILAAGLSVCARAQNAPVPTKPPDPPSLTEGVSTGEVKIELERFGVGGQARIGDWCGIRMGISDSASKQRELIVRLEGVDADGDKPWYQMSMTANPGTTQQAWLYCRIPFEYANRGGDTMKVAVYEGIETTDGSETGTPGYRAGKMLGALPVAPRNTAAVLSPVLGMIAVIGQHNLGLMQYNLRSGSTEPSHEFGNEATVVVDGLVPEDLPDRWMGLAPYEAVVWANGDPAKLRGEKARAVRDWVERGGHLIIVLPPVGQTWMSKSSNELWDMMPNVEVTSKEKVAFDAYRPLITTWNGITFPKTATVQNFKAAAGAAPSEASCVLNGPDGECVVVRREVGAGAVTMVGLDLNQTALSQGDLIDAEVFWHRVLGRRGDTVAPVKSATGPGPVASMFGRRASDYDGAIAGEIATQGTSAAGVLIGFIVFALYWAVAGPLGFAVLKRRGLSQHSWIFFVGTTAVFTVLAWSGAQALRPKKTEGTHLTILDHVFGQPTQRARMWCSVLLPWYGHATLAVGDPAEIAANAASGAGTSARRSLNSITSWDSPEAGSGGFGGFPDARGYMVDSKNPDSMTVPTRQTVKQVQVDWAGGPRWEMPFPVNDDGSPGVGTLRLHSAEWNENKSPLVTGTLVHKLPAVLRDVKVIVVTGQRRLAQPQARRESPRSEAPMICQAEAFYAPLDWEPGKPLSLDAVTRIATEAAGKAKTHAEFYFKGLVPETASDAFSAPTVDKPKEDFLARLAFYSQLPNPATDARVSVGVPLRMCTHGWDLGRWFTRPCVIVIGELRDQSPSPVPLTVDGKTIPTSGRTLVRWVYPLADAPPPFPATGAAVDGKSSTSDGAASDSPEESPSTADSDPKNPGRKQPKTSGPGRAGTPNPGAVPK